VSPRTTTWLTNVGAGDNVGRTKLGDGDDVGDELAEGAGLRDPGALSPSSCGANAIVATSRIVSSAARPAATAAHGAVRADGAVRARNSGSMPPV
jgi:hypothetical protein